VVPLGGFGEITDDQPGHEYTDGRDSNESGRSAPPEAKSDQDDSPDEDNKLQRVNGPHGVRIGRDET
jgi:hypothetical protein